MSATREITIWCEGKGCGVWARESTSKTSIARAILMRQGWSCTPAGDFCPECAKDRKEKKP